MSLLKPNICMVCGKQLSTPSNLRRHASLHLEPSLECTVCQKGFHSQSALDIHRRVHTRETPHVCPTCGDIFTSVYNLRHHESSVHRREKSFKCDICEASFCRNVTIEAHLLEHSGDSKYSCFLCEKGYKCKRSLKLHKCFKAVKIFTYEICKKNLHEAALPQTTSPQAQQPKVSV